MRLAREQLAVLGDFVEMGCYKGDTSLLLAEVLQCGARLRQEVRGSTLVTSDEIPEKLDGDRASDTDVEKPVENFEKRLWIYDSFEGLPEKGEADKSVVGEEFRGGELVVTKREVKERFLRAGLKLPIIKKAWFSELTDADMPEKIALAFLDGDFYESIRDSLKLVGSKMARDGIIIVHDYNNPALPGVAKAVDEWTASGEWGMQVFETMVILRKSSSKSVGGQRIL